LSIDISMNAFVYWTDHCSLYSLSLIPLMNELEITFPYAVFCFSDQIYRLILPPVKVHSKLP